jgi:acyl-CoA dehydrogenase
MDFALAPAIEDCRQRIALFVERHLLPLERDPAAYDSHENIAEAPLQRLRALARSEGLWALQTPVALGGGGLPVVGLAACYEAMNRSIFGPVVFNSAAPDDGNMILLEKVATEAQKERWLQPIIDGKVRSAFVMTEPAPGAGSDPAGMMRTRARRQGDRWIVEGHKWFITGAEAAQHFILVARTGDDPKRGLTTFLFHRDQPGWEIVRRIPIMGPEEHGGHCELRFHGLEIPDENRLMGEGEGMKATQIRLGTARLTHCMRWLGLADRTLELSRAYVTTRQSFGQPLARHQLVQRMIAENASAIHAGNLMTFHCAWMLERGLAKEARPYSSMAKNHVARTLCKVLDDAIQMHGALGYSDDMPFAQWYRSARAARIADGPDEVHSVVVARDYLLADLQLLV